MAIIGVSQARQYAASAGFSGNALNIIVAIAQAESSLNTTARNTNVDGSVDRGILQINSRWHPEVSTACADNPACAFKEGYRISSRGTNFTPWSTYNNGAYLKYLNTSTSQQPQGKLWYQYTESRGWDPSIPHYAIDIPMPVDTPFFFLQGPGTVTKAGYKPWGGEIYYDPDPPGGVLEYALHLDNVFVQPGQRIRSGQVVGTSGGQLSGGDHPASSDWSTGAHLHWGLFTEYRGGLPYGPDPDALLDDARAGRLPVGQGGTDYTISTDTQQESKAPAPMAYRVNAILSNLPGFAGIAVAIDEANQFPGVIWHNPGESVPDARPWHEYILNPGLAFSDTAARLDPTNHIGAAIRSVLDTIISNTIPLAIRSLIVFTGMLLIAGLIWHAVQASGVAQTGVNIATRGMGETAMRSLV